MELLIEVKLLDECLLITCHSNMTIGEMSLIALSEYDAAHLNNTPKNVQHVKDCRGRILSGSIKLGGLQNQELFEIVVYDESYVQSQVLEPPTLKMMHEKWSMFTVYQMEQYLNSVTNTESVPFDSREIFGLLDELKHSKAEGVQGHVVKCFELMLNSSRNVVLIKYIADELQSLFKLTNHEAIALDILKQIQKLHRLSKTCIKVEELMENVYSKIKTFGCNNEEFLKYCDYKVEEEKQPITERSDERRKKNSEEKREVTRSNEVLPRRGRDHRHQLAQVDQDQDQDQEKMSSFCSPPASSRMGLSRVLELLRSEDINCRSFALEKLLKCSITQQQSRPSSQADKAEKDDILAEIQGSDQTEDLLRALFSCLKQSIKPPGEILAKTAMKVRQPLAFLIADKALHSPDSNFTAIFSCIKCIHWIVKEWAYDSCIGIISEKWRILLTLTHASDRQDEDLEIAEKCGELLILLTNMHGWKKYNVKLEKDSITYFLGSEHPLMRTILALSYIRCNSNFENVNNKHSRGDGENDVSNIICSNDFANLRSIWRWSIGRYSQNVCIQALEVLSSALVLSEVKAHLIKYDPLEKLMRLLERHVVNEMDVRGGMDRSNVSPNVLVIRFSLKALVNLNSAASEGQYQVKIERAMKDTRLGTDLFLLASQDELIGFYMQLLVNE